jgi:hypothetical protein
MASDDISVAALALLLKERKKRKTGGLNWRKTFVLGEKYQKNDLICSDDIIYIADRATTESPLIDGWSIFVDLRDLRKPGIKGDTGEKGARGEAGIRGLDGLSIKGEQGEQGLTGLRGPQGLSIQGEQGLRGERGPQGLQGDPGVSIRGADGAKGAQGPQGPDGRDGKDGLITILESNDRGKNLDLRMFWAGEWDHKKTYKRGDVVYFERAMWVALEKLTGVKPPEVRWEHIMSMGGSVGGGGIAQGQRGPAGPQGPPGSGGAVAQDADFTWNVDGTLASILFEDASSAVFDWNVDGTLNTITQSGVVKTFTWNVDGTLASMTISS